MSEQILDQSVQHFLDTLASAAPTPGGGSVAALTGAMAAGLLVMVCDLTIGKKAYAEFEADAVALRERAEATRQALQQLAQDDIDVFERLSAAYKLPKAADADAATRRAAIQTVTRHATVLPLRMVRALADLVPLCAPLAQHSSRLAVSDVGVAAHLIRAAVPSALLNVDINLAALEDQMFVRETRALVQDITGGIDAELDRVIALVAERIRM